MLSDQGVGTGVCVGECVGERVGVVVPWLAQGHKRCESDHWPGALHDGGVAGL